MLAFKVSLNRKRVATTGIPGPHVLSAIITSVTRDREERRLWQWRPRDFRTKELDLDLGGLISHADGAKEHVKWAHLKLKVGDTVTVSVVDADQVDEPNHRSKTEGYKIEEVERRQLDHLLRKYGAPARRPRPTR